MEEGYTRPNHGGALNNHGKSHANGPEKWYLGFEKDKVVVWNRTYPASNYSQLCTRKGNLLAWEGIDSGA